MEFEVPTHGTFALYSRLYSTLHMYEFRLRLKLFFIQLSHRTSPSSHCQYARSIPNFHPWTTLTLTFLVAGLSLGNSLLYLERRLGLLPDKPSYITVWIYSQAASSRSPLPFSLSPPLPLALPLALLVSASWVCADFALSLVCSLSLWWVATTQLM